MDAQTLADNIGRVIITPLIVLLFAVALMVFVWGVVEYLIDLNIRGKNSGKGKQHMLWGIVGMFIMTAAWGILNLIQGTLSSIGPTSF